MTLIFYEANEDQVMNIKATLLWFEVDLSLKVNFKSKLIDVKVEDQLQTS